jgi:hypothetical protein
MDAQAAIDQFTREELEEMAPLFAERFAQQLRRQGKVASGALLRSMTSLAVGGNQIQAGFLGYGRFVDMGARGGWRKGVYTGQRTPGVKPRKAIFYSRVKYGLYGQLVSNLSNKFVDTLYEQAQSQLTNER